MSKLIIKALAIFIFMCSMVPTFAHEHCYKSFPTTKEQNKIDKMLEQRLNLTKEQLDYLHKQKPKHKKEIETAVKKMQAKHDQIRRIYMLGLPRFQSDLRSAPYKAELVLLKQNADKIKESHRKDFESILTPEQKAEFEKIRKEYAAKKIPPKN